MLPFLTDLFFAFIFGLVEGVTEFLPVSSTAHLILTGRLLGISQTEFVSTFGIAIQSGAILAVIMLYRTTLLRNREILKRVLVAFIPTALIGLAAYRFIKDTLFHSHGVIIGSLFLGGLFLIFFEKFHKEGPKAYEKLEKIPYRKFVWIGVFQAMAMVPGVSRSGATIIGGLFLGLRRKPIVEFSFLLALPTLLAATALDLAHVAGGFSAYQFLILLAGFAVSFVMALFSMKFLLHFVKNHSFIFFGVYRIAAAFFFWYFV